MAFFLVLESEEVVRGGVPDIVHFFQEDEVAVIDLGEGEAFVFPFGVGTQGIVLGEDPIESGGRRGKGRDVRLEAGMEDDEALEGMC